MATVTLACPIAITSGEVIVSALVIRAETALAVRQHVTPMQEFEATKQTMDPVDGFFV